MRGGVGLRDEGKREQVVERAESERARASPHESPKTPLAGLMGNDRLAPTTPLMARRYDSQTTTFSPEGEFATRRAREVRAACTGGGARAHVHALPRDPARGATETQTRAWPARG